jgi:hypothetical protein
MKTTREVPLHTTVLTVVMAVGFLGLTLGLLYLQAQGVSEGRTDRFAPVTDPLRKARLCNALHAREEVTAACNARAVLEPADLFYDCVVAHTSVRPSKKVESDEAVANCMGRVRRSFTDDRPVPGTTTR